MAGKIEPMKLATRRVSEAKKPALLFQARQKPQRLIGAGVGYLPDPSYKIQCCARGVGWHEHGGWPFGRSSLRTDQKCQPRNCTGCHVLGGLLFGPDSSLRGQFPSLLAQIIGAMVGRWLSRNEGNLDASKAWGEIG